MPIVQQNKMESKKTNTPSLDKLYRHRQNELTGQDNIRRVRIRANPRTPCTARTGYHLARMKPSLHPRLRGNTSGTWALTRRRKKIVTSL